jgi:hypothetical protein
MREEAPQSIRKRVTVVSTSMQVLNRPPLPKASPLPRKVSRMAAMIPKADVGNNGASNQNRDAPRPHPVE